MVRSTENNFPWSSSQQQSFGHHSFFAGHSGVSAGFQLLSTATTLGEMPTFFVPCYTVVWYVVTVDIIWRVFPFLTDVIFYLIENRLCTTYLWNLFAHWYLVVNYKCDIPPNSQNPELFGCMIVATLYFMKISRNFDFRNLVFYKRSKISFQICGPLQHFERLCATCWHLNY